jgi:hypothetical protein
VADAVADVTPLTSAFPTNQPNTSGASSGTATETPLNATKANPLGVEAPDIAARQVANRKLEGVTGEEGANLENRAALGLGEANANAGVTGDSLAEMHKYHDAYQKELTTSMAEGKRLHDAIDAASNFHDLWEQKPMADRALATIASGLLGFGTGQAHNVVKDLSDADHQRQVDKVNTLMKIAEMHGADQKRLMEIHEDATANLTLMQSLKYKKIADEYAKQGAMAGTVEAKTAAAKAQAMFLKLAAEEKLKYDMSRRVKASRSATQATKTPVAGGPAF